MFDTKICKMVICLKETVFFKKSKMGRIQLLSITSYDIIKMNRVTKILVTVTFLLMGVLPSMSQRHMDFFGMPIHGKIGKMEQYIKNKGWKVWFQRHGIFQLYWSPIDTRMDLGFAPCGMTIGAFCSPKSSKITAMTLDICYEERDSIYESYKARITERYGKPRFFNSNYTSFLCKNKRGKIIGCILLVKCDYDIKMLIHVIDFKNHWKASMEGGRYLKDIYSFIIPDLFRGESIFQKK